MTPPKLLEGRLLEEDFKRLLYDEGGKLKTETVRLLLEDDAGRVRSEVIDYILESYPNRLSDSTSTREDDCDFGNIIDQLRVNDQKL